MQILDLRNSCATQVRGRFLHGIGYRQHRLMFHGHLLRKWIMVISVLPGLPVVKTFCQRIDAPA